MSTPVGYKQVRLYLWVFVEDEPLVKSNEKRKQQHFCPQRRSSKQRPNSKWCDAVEAVAQKLKTFYNLFSFPQTFFRATLIKFFDETMCGSPEAAPPQPGFPSLIYEQNHNEAFVFSTKENKTTAAEQRWLPVTNNFVVHFQTFSFVILGNYFN